MLSGSAASRATSCGGVAAPGRVELVGLVDQLGRALELQVANRPIDDLHVEAAQELVHRLGVHRASVSRSALAAYEPPARSPRA